MTTKDLQEFLCLHGLLVKIDGVNGPATQAALKKFQGGNKLVSDGVLSPQTTALLTHPLTAASSITGMETTSFADAVVMVAKRYLSYHPREVGGQNRGPWVRFFMMGKEGDDFPWCAGAASTILALADKVFKGNPLTYSMSCDRLAEQAKGKGRLTSSHEGLNPGCLFLIRGKSAGDWVHVGIVTAFNSDHFVTCEGNTNDSGEREGYEYCARIRSYNNVDFVRL